MASGTQPYDTYESAVAADGPAAQFRFDDVVGSGTLADSVGSFTATDSGIVLGGAGPFTGSKSGSFGGSAFASLPSNPLAGTGVFSAEAWVNWTGGASYKQPIFDFGSSTTNYMYLTPASALTNHTMLFEIRTSAGAVFQVQAPTLTAKAWEYVAVTETSSGTLALYLNGKQVGQTTGVTITPASLGGTANDWLGKSQISGDPMFNGKASNVAFYSVALSAEQILNHYNAGEFPVNSALPTISGTAKDGQMLAASTGTWTGLTPMTFAYQWLRCSTSGEECVNISGATSSSYQAGHEDVGHTLRTKVTATNGAGSGSATSAHTGTVAALAPSNTALPAISGEATDGQILGASTGTWNGTPPLTYTYQWRTCNSTGESCSNISGATSSTYVLGHGDVGRTLRVVVTAKNSAGSSSATSVQSAVVAALAPSNTSLPTISGTTQDGQTVTGSTGSWSGTPPLTYAYQWQSCDGTGANCADVTGATGPTYALDHGDVGTTLRLVVTATNSAGSATAASATSAIVVPLAPSNVTPPAISGTARDGQTLSASAGSWNGTPPFSYAYQWQTCNSSGGSCTNVAGATGSTYGLSPSDVGTTVRVAITATNTAGSASSSSEATAVVAAIAPSNTAAPTISGTVQDGQTLTANAGNWVGTPPLSYSYQWQSCDSLGANCAEITGASAATYTLGHGDVGRTIRVAVTATNAAGAASSTSEATGVVNALAPTNVGAPSVLHQPVVGAMLNASVGEWSGTSPFSYAYQWQSCNNVGSSCTDIAGATTSSYMLASGDLGTTLRVLVTASNAAGSASAISPASAAVSQAAPPSNTSLPSITGNPQEGQLFSANPGVWTGAPQPIYAYQWQSCNPAGEECQNIEGAASQTYTLSAADAGTTLRVVVTATNLSGSATAISAASPPIEAGPPSELEAPTITGSANVGEALQAAAGEWGGSETEISYQWQRCDPRGRECTDIAGETKPEYTLSGGDVGTTLRVRIGASNQRGSVTDVSAATAVVSAPALTLLNTLAPSISGATQSGQTLTVNPGSWLGNAAIAYSYQWQSCDSFGSGCEEISGATSASYVPGPADVGHRLRVRLTAIEVSGALAESWVATQPIAAPNAPVLEQSPVVSGTGLAGYTLTASTGVWSAEDALSYGYQWERCSERGEGCSAIAGATTNRYTFAAGDAGSTLRVVVMATDIDGSAVGVSDATAVVSPATLVDVSVPSISGDDKTWQPLTAEPGIWTGAGAISYAYQWERCDAEGMNCTMIAGASKSSYTPNMSDAGSTVIVAVTATSPTAKITVSSMPTPMIAAVEAAPENTSSPSIDGYATSGDTLTAKTGSWSGSEPISISYTYQWERCNTEGEECANIEAATSETYVLGMADLNSTVRLVVTATNSFGSMTATSEPSEVIDAPGPPLSTEAPAIRGTFQVGEELIAGNGTWLGSRPLTFFYRWERCNTSGEACNPIEGATTPGYTLATADVNTAVRVRVTVTNSLGSVSVVSAASTVAPAGQAVAGQATELAERADPSVLAPSISATIEEQSVKPAVEDPGEELTSNTTLTTSSTSKETSGEFAVNTPAGQLSFMPVDTSPNATTLPTVVNGTAMVYAETSQATDTIVRPDPLGATTLLQLRSSEAPRSFSWEVGLGADQELQRLPDGSVAVVEPPSGTIIEGSLPEESLGAGEPEPPGETAGQEGVNSQAADAELESSVKEDTTLEKLPAAPQTTTSPITPKTGELHPQETQAKYEAAKSAVGYAEAQTAGTTLMVIELPKVMDAAGNLVPATLSVQGQLVTLTITPGSGAAFPLTAETSVAALSDQAGAARVHGARYGLSDQKSVSFTTSEENDKPVEHFDARLKSGPMHIGTARLVVPYNTPVDEPHLIAWLKAVKSAGLRPYITFGPPYSELCKKGSPCPEPKLGPYKEGVTRLIGGLMARHRSEPGAIPAITLWGAWNEPDRSPMRGYPGQAALFWKVTRAILKSKGCACTLVAGEFAEYSTYIQAYEKAILKNRQYWVRKPHVWGLHDYEDLVNFYREHRNPAAAAFAHITSKRLGYPRLLLSEQGVELQNEVESTALEGHLGRQKLAAEDFLKLSGLSKRIDLVDYYEYRGPTAEDRAKDKKPHLFDSALLPGEGTEPSDWRPAYCVLALGRRDCPARAATESPIEGTTTTTASTELLTVDPGTSPASYWIEYGLTAEYGQSTMRVSLPNPEGTQSETVALSGLKPCTTYHYQAEAENEGNEGTPSLGGDQTFRTYCLATAVAAGYEHSCALLTDTGVDCWGRGRGADVGPSENADVPVRVKGLSGVAAISAGWGYSLALLSNGTVAGWGANGEGQLGDGSVTNQELTPVAVSGLSGVTAISAGGGHALALLSNGTVMAWGDNQDGALGNGTQNNSDLPVPVSGLSGVIAISAGYEHSLALLSNGTVMAWGANFAGDLGDGSYPGPEICGPENRSCSKTPVAVSGLSDAIAVSAGGEHSLALLSSGTVMAWGANYDGQLGDGTWTGPEKCSGTVEGCSTIPVAVSGLSDVTAISAANGWHSLALRSDSTVMAWGDSEFGQMGDGSYTGPDLCSGLPCSLTPASVGGLNTATSISAGLEGGVVLLSNGSVQTWGTNLSGQLGDGTETGPERCWGTPCSTVPVDVRGLP